MTTQLIIVTHGEIGRALVDAAKQTYNGAPLPITLFSVSTHADPEKSKNK